MFGFSLLVIVLIAALAGGIAFYAKRDFTLPGYQGRGGVVLLGSSFGLGILALWLVGRMAGVGNIFAATAASIEFNRVYDDALQNAGAWSYLAGVIALGIALFLHWWSEARAEL